jgi:hypothetical protein
MTDATFTGLCWGFAAGAFFGGWIGFLWGAVHTVGKLKATWDTGKDAAR